MDTDDDRRYFDKAQVHVANSSVKPSIPKWNFFRYDVLPPALAPFPVALERMLMRAFATVLENKCGIRWIEIGGCALANDRVDRERRCTQI